jgi:hypothetical protein
MLPNRTPRSERGLSAGPVPRWSCMRPPLMRSLTTYWPPTTQLLAPHLPALCNRVPFTRRGALFHSHVSHGPCRSRSLGPKEMVLELVCTASTMEQILSTQFDRVDKALSTLVDSIAAYNPSPQAAIDLVAADDELSHGLDQRKSHILPFRMSNTDQTSGAAPGESRAHPVVARRSQRAPGAAQDVRLCPS